MGRLLFPTTSPPLSPLRYLQLQTLGAGQTVPLVELWEAAGPNDAANLQRGCSATPSVALPMRVCLQGHRAVSEQQRAFSEEKYTPWAGVKDRPLNPIPWVQARREGPTAHAQPWTVEVEGLQAGTGPTAAPKGSGPSLPNRHLLPGKSYSSSSGDGAQGGPSPAQRRTARQRHSLACS